MYYFYGIITIFSRPIIYGHYVVMYGKNFRTDFRSNRWAHLPEIWWVGRECGTADIRNGSGRECGTALNDIIRNGSIGDRLSLYAHFCINHNSYCMSETAWGGNLTVGIGVQSAITINF